MGLPRLERIEAETKADAIIRAGEVAEKLTIGETIKLFDEPRDSAIAEWMRDAKGLHRVR